MALVEKGKMGGQMLVWSTSVSHQGYRDVHGHINGQVHLLKAKDVDSSFMLLKEIS